MRTKKMKKLGFILVALIATLLIPFTALASDTIKVAYIAPTSGAFAAVGDQSNKQFEFTQDYINAKGGVLGKKLDIISFDNKNAAGETVFQFKRAINQGIRIIMQCHSSGCSNALSDAIRKYNTRNPDKQVILFVHDSTDPTLTNEKCHFMFFRWGPTADQKVAALVAYLAADKDVKKVFLINMDYSHGHGVSAVSRRELKKRRPDISIVGNVFHPVGKIKDFSPYINAIKVSGADAVITGNWGTDMNMLIKGSHDAGLKVKWATLYAGVIGAPSVLREAGIGTLQVTTWHANYNDGDNETTQKFALKFKEKYGLDFYYQDQNTQLMMLCAAIKKAKSVDPVDIAFALEGMKFQTPTGECLMRADNHQAVMPQIISVFSKDAKYDVEGTGLGWKTVMTVPSKDVYFPTTCKMVRPSR